MQKEKVPAHPKLYSNKTTPILLNIEQIAPKIGEATQWAVSVELKMRLIAQFSEPVRQKLSEITKESYHECNLFQLEEAIIAVFHDKLTSHELETLKKFRKPRNKLVHSDFVSFMELLQIIPEGRIISSQGTRELLDPSNIKDAVLGLDWNNALSKFRLIASEVSNILDRLFRGLAID